MHISKGNNLNVKSFQIYAFFGSYDPYLHQNDVISTRFAQFEHNSTNLTPLKCLKPYKSICILAHNNMGNISKVKSIHCFSFFRSCGLFCIKMTLKLSKTAQNEATEAVHKSHRWHSKDFIYFCSNNALSCFECKRGFLCLFRVLKIIKAKEKMTAFVR